MSETAQKKEKKLADSEKENINFLTVYIHFYVKCMFLNTFSQLSAHLKKTSVPLSAFFALFK